MLKKDILYGLCVADLTDNDAKKIISILEVKKLFPLGNWSNEFLVEYLYNFWDWETSEYIQEKLLKKHGLHKRYVDRRQGAIKNYWRPYFSSKIKLTNITKADLKKFILSFSNKQQPASADGKNDIIRSGLLPLKYAYENDLIPMDITKGLHFFSDEKQERFILDEKTVAKLFSRQWENPIAELANKLALITGLRAGEIQALRQCDLFETYLTVNHSWNYVDGLKVTKNKKNRRALIPFGNVMIELKKLADSNPFTLNGEGYIFYATIPNKPQDGKYWLRELRKELRSMGETDEIIRQATFHGWRHLFTTHIRRNGYLADNIIQKITGHKTLEMLNHYSNHSLLEDDEKILLTTKEVFEPFLN